IEVAQASETEGRALRVSLDVFDGPLDLLLHLVRERELDIATVPLAAVAQQYFDYIAVMSALDVELAGEYLVIAATLVFLKSRALLPAIPAEFLSEGEESAEEVEERLRRRLITYSKYKGVAEELRAQQDEAASYFYRDAGDPTSQIVQRYRIAPPKLAAALLAAIRSAKPEKRTIARERFSIARQMEFVFAEVRSKGRVGFLELCREMDRVGIIATFLAVLELIRQHRVAYEQKNAHDDLRLFPFDTIAVNAN
ncbi:MAG: segregation/condensation protein A, partial [Candidatus Eremiobacteraeota bacterium]|nr:segregation/condensation protein A [Candidatus Eremiobacteraeota bacterium]